MSIGTHLIPCFQGTRLRIAALLCLLAMWVSPLTAGNAGIKSANAVRASEPPRIDGDLSDPVWQSAPVMTDFTQFQPVNGPKASQRTEVRVLYDDQAVYVSAMLYDTAPDSILKQLGKRDIGENNSDLFEVSFDTYDDDQNCYTFMVSAAGVQTDARQSQLGYDVVWDAVWKSEVGFSDQGWMVEIELPYSALRFSKQEVQNWGMQFVRVIRRHREKATWNFTDRAVEGYVNQFGELAGLKGIEPPLRLALTPYVSAYAQRQSQGMFGPGEVGTIFNAGADLKWGITESFTLDMTMVPDFGQVVADNQVLNLSPFEVQFQENRQFFTEGTELFNIAGLFYSRRIGGTPRNRFAVADSLREGEVIEENPQSTRLVNAFKLSGRNRKKTGLGLFNGMTAASKARISGPDGIREVTTQAFTNYNVAVIDQPFWGNSYASLINTNRLEADGYMANVTATRFRLADAGNAWFVEGSGTLSQKWQNIRTDGPQLGHAYYYAAGKGSGNATFRIGQVGESHTYDINDMGFLYNNNEFTDFAIASYNIYQPFSIFNAQYNSLSIFRSSLYQPRRFQSFEVAANHNFQLKSFDFFGVNYGVSPVGTQDFFESRIPGKVISMPWDFFVGGFISTNYARRFALDVFLSYRKIPGWDNQIKRATISPRFRINDKLMLIHSFYYNFNDNNRGFTTFDSLDNSIIGIRDRRDMENVFTVEYSFTNRMALSFRTRHYWSRVRYEDFLTPGDNGELLPSDYSGNRDINFNVFNVDAVFQWRFAPGSDLFVVWKNSILESGDQVIDPFFDNLRNTFQSPQTNSISVRLLYYLDFMRFQRRGT